MFISISNVSEILHFLKLHFSKLIGEHLLTCNETKKIILFFSTQKTLQCNFINCTHFECKKMVIPEKNTKKKKECFLLILAALLLECGMKLTASSYFCMWVYVCVFLLYFTSCCRRFAFLCGPESSRGFSFFQVNSVECVCPAQGFQKQYMHVGTKMSHIFLYFSSFHAKQMHQKQIRRERKKNHRENREKKHFD